MPGKRIRHATAAGVVMMTLILAVPAQAGGWTPSWNPGADVWQTAWSWLAKLWPGAPAAIRPADRGTHELTKSDRGSAIGPNGTPSTSATPPCETNCERGTSIDPNG